jgi:hypothetical protein
MTNAIEPGEAGTALAEIRRREHQVVDAAIVPTWFWWAIAIASVALGAIVDARNGVAIGAAAVVYAIGVTVLALWVGLGGVRRVKVHEGLLGAEGAGLIVGFVGIVVPSTIALAFVLEAMGVAQAGTISTLACGAALVVGGPMLMRRLRLVMLRHGAGPR